ncbi:hypothetical protein VHARVF571_120088 [Vibrio harveyi]|nr:hypothetical protein VHARVF571_120088 [Vibrio harveyi]
MIVAELILLNVIDGEALLNLLKQTRQRTLDISGNGTYDTRSCY